LKDSAGRILRLGLVQNILERLTDLRHTSF
jgi:hypothetical protein